MPRSLLILIIALLFPWGQVLATSADSGAIPLPQLQWKPSDAFAKIEVVNGKRIAVVDVPAEAEAEVKKKAHVFTAPFDLAMLPEGTYMMSIRARWNNVTQPSRSWFGTTFMLAYTDSKGIKQWPGAQTFYGDSDWTELSKRFIAPDKGSHSAIFHIGLEDCSGHIEFDLDSLEIASVLNQEYRRLQDYQVTYPERVAHDIQRRGVVSPSVFTEKDMQTLKEWNVNLVRYQIFVNKVARKLTRDGLDQNFEEYDRCLEPMLPQGDEVLKWATERNIKVVIGLNVFPGGKLGKEFRIFHEKASLDHYVKTWQKIANHYKGNPAVWGYDLINEPNTTGKASHDYLVAQTIAAKAIREIDPDTPIIIESNSCDIPLTYQYLTPLELDNVIYEVHVYDPLEYTHQGVKTNPQGPVYPGLIKDIQYDRNKLREILQPVRDFQLKHNARIFVGEFSAAAWAPGAERYLEDCITLFEEYGWDWTYHAFREWSGWSVEHEGENRNSMRPCADTPRKQVLLNYFKRNKY